MHKKAQSKQKLRELIWETKEYITDVDTVWLLIIMHFKMTHYCVSGENGSRLLELNSLFFFFFPCWTMEALCLWNPERLSMQVMTVLFWSEVQHSVWEKDTRGCVFWDGQLWPWKRGWDKAHIQTNLTGHNPVSGWERHRGSVWTQPRGSVPWWDTGDILALPGLCSRGCQPTNSQLQHLGDRESQDCTPSMWIIVYTISACHRGALAWLLTNKC